MTTGQDSLIVTLIQNLQAAELTIRIHAGLLLGQMGLEARPALPALLHLRNSMDVHDRRLATMTLGSLAHDLTEAVPPLLNALHDEDDAVRRLASEALEEMTPATTRKAA